MLKDAQWWVEYRQRRTQELRDYQKKRYWEKKGLPVPVEEVVAAVVPKPMKMTKATEVVYKRDWCPRCNHTMIVRKDPLEHGGWVWSCEPCIEKEKLKKNQENKQMSV